jgi:site-specific DNA-methyltransferase (adenine-specific)
MSKENDPRQERTPPHPKGRWPANVLHDGSDEVEAEFAKAGVSVSSGRIMKPGTKTALGQGSNWNDHNNKERVFKGLGDIGTPSRYFQQCPPDSTQHPDAARFRYCPKASNKERATPGNNHPTQKPLSLMRYLARLTKTPTGGIVLDPFAGSGTTALACIPEGRDYILIEKEPEYAEICRRRIAEYTGQEITPKEIELADNQKVKQMSLW